MRPRSTGSTTPTGRPTRRARLARPPQVTGVRCSAMGDRSAWIRWGIASAVTGMLAWVVAVALIPLDAKLERGDRSLATTIATHSARLYAAALLAIAGAVLLVAFFA